MDDVIHSVDHHFPNGNKGHPRIAMDNDHPEDRNVQQQGRIGYKHDVGNKKIGRKNRIKKQSERGGYPLSL